MGIFSRFPYTDFHRLNADWILEKVKEMLGLTQQAAETVEGYEDRLSDVETAAAGAVRFDADQDLSSSQKTQGRSNIDAASQTDLIDYVEALQDLIDMLTSQVRNCVRFDLAQTLTGTQKAQARSNIGAADAIDVEQVIRDLKTLSTYAVMVNAAQTFTDAQKAQARANIGAAAEGEAPAPAGAVLYDQSQSLTSEQQGTARNNINAAGLTDPSFDGSIQLSISSGVTYEADEIQLTPNSAQDQSILNMLGLQSSHVIIRGIDDPVNDYDAVNLKTLYAAIIKEVTVSGNTPTIDLADEIEGDAYETLITCTGSALTSITITTAANSTMLATIVFTTGSTAPTFDSPLAINGLDDLVPEANMIYEISIRSNRAVWHSWEVVS